MQQSSNHPPNPLEWRPAPCHPRQICVGPPVRTQDLPSRPAGSFDSGRTLVKPAAKQGLASVASALREIPSRKFCVDGHTDDVPIHNNHFASNWELSTARAIAVTHLLVDAGLAAEVVSVGGHADLDPVVPNDSAEHRKLNRRIEIVIEPNLSELPTLGLPPSSARHQSHQSRRLALNGPPRSAGQAR